jgi:hypothetical protein
VICKSNMLALEHRCNRILDLHDTIPINSSNEKRTNKSKKRRRSDFDRPQAKRAKLDDKNDGMANITKNCKRKPCKMIKTFNRLSRK